MKSFSAAPLFLIAFLIFQNMPAFGAETAGKEDASMGRNEAASKNMKHWGAQDALKDADPELAAIKNNLLYGQILDHGSLTDVQRALVILASLTAAQNFHALPGFLESALLVGASADEIHESLYQCAPYVGFPRVEEAILIANKIFVANGVKLPLQSQATVNEQTRFKDGLAVQKKIFGADTIGNMQAKAPSGQQDIVTDYLSAYCFGDFYTRKCLDLKMRELITFSAIVSLGGCDPQARAHAHANISVGNSKQNLVDALAVMLPFIGFPRTLNGLAAVNAAVPE